MSIFVVCPYCGRKNDQHAQMARVDEPGAERPIHQSAGTASLCFGCGGISVVVRAFVGVSLRKPTDEEWAQLDAQEVVVKARATWAEQFHREPAR